MDGGWTLQESPFHEGEQQVQRRLGVRDEMEEFARRVVRDHMPDQHRAFYSKLPYLMVGSVDERGRPWASMLAAEPGFIGSPDARTLTVAARPFPGDPLNETLREGGELGLLGIMLDARRRNRLTGTIGKVGEDSFEVKIRQAFGNCPQYIQSRDLVRLPNTDPAEARVFRKDALDRRTRAIVENADTLFIATAWSGAENVASNGADVSHRGGKPGFVRIEDDRTFVFPDFSGNNHFNTVGNIVLNPRAGFLFMDFETRDVVTMTGVAEIVWEGEDVKAFAGAERLIRFRAEQIIHIEAILPFTFDFNEYSPMLDHTGDWRSAAEIAAAERERNTYTQYEIVDVLPESGTITSFYLKRADGKAHAGFKPGQFLPIRLDLPGLDKPAMRTYTLSDAPEKDRYRLSIKKEPGDALVSRYLHDHARPGFRLEAMAPRGSFVLDQSSDRPVVLISAGIGITPMIAMSNFIRREGLRTRYFRRTHFIHGARNGDELAFTGQIRRLAAEHEHFTAHIRLSKPGKTDRLGETHDSEGRVDIDLLRRVLPFDDYDFYLCGPADFMQDLYDGLVGLGIRADRIHYESFGPATVLNHDRDETPTPKGEIFDGPVEVSFSKSGKKATWTPEKGTLLDLAEASGLMPDFSCRSGVCGTCATRLTCGGADYLEEPSAAVDGGEVLICCATPRPASGAESCGGEAGIVLDL